MAVSIKQKQAFLEAYGETKSVAYFMTGPNLGSDWSWSKALAGGYSQADLDEFLSKGKAAYSAHKNKSSSTSAPDPPDTPGQAGVPTACAKTAAKAVTTAVSQMKNAVYQVFYHVDPLKGIKVLTEGTVLDAGEALSKKLYALKADLVGELGSEIAPEVVQVQAAIDALKAIETMKFAQDAVFDFQQGLIKFPSTGELLEEMNLLAASLGKRVKTLEQAEGYLNELLAGTVADSGTELKNLVAAFREEVSEQMDAMARIVYSNAVQEVGGSIDVVPYLQGFQNSAQFYDLDTAAKAVGKVADNLDQWAQGLGYSSFDEAPNFIRQLDPGLASRVAIEEIVSQQQAKMLDLISPQDWLGGAVLQADAPITKYATFADFKSEFDDLQALTQKLGISSKAVFDIDVPLGTLETAFDQAQDIAGIHVPGAKQSALGFDADDVLAATTDELNPMVQAALEEQDEVPSLVYFMTKKQKQDLLIDPDQFALAGYEVKYKGQVLTGNGLDTAKQKYAIKQGDPPPKATVHAEKSTGSAAEALDQKAPATDAGGTDVITGEPIPIPAGSPKWYADPFTEKQANYLESLITKNSLEEVFEEAGWYEAAKSGTLTKGQMSHAIDLTQKLDDETIAFVDADDVKLAMKYGDPSLGKSSVAQAVKNVEQAGDSIEDVLAASAPGPNVSTAKPASSIAPDNAHWDAPHSWTYMGDGQSKWGGAHRKWWFQDEDGNDWMLKHGADFRAEGELAAHRVAHAAGYDVAEARVVTLKVGGRSETGVIQRMYRSDDIVGTLDDALGHAALSDLPEETLQQLQQHQVLDWLLGNHDSHMQNFLVLRDGRLVGVDKGQAFKFYGKDRLAHDYKPDGNFGEIAYNRMWRQYRDGELDLDLDVIDDALARIEAMSDVELARLVDSYAQGRFNAPASQAFLQGTSARNSAELLEAVLERKRNIRRDFEVFYREQAQARGVTWEPKWSQVKKSVHQAKPKVTSAADVLTPIDEEFAASLNRVGTSGKSVYVAGTEVERGQILFDVVADAQGKKMVRVHAHLRPGGNGKLMKLLKSEAGEDILQHSAAADGVPLRVQTVAGWQNDTVSAAKTINHHISSGDFEFNQSTLNKASEILADIQKDGVVEQWVRTEGLETAEAVLDAHPEAFRIGFEELVDASERLSRSELDEWITQQATRAAELRAMMHHWENLPKILEQGRAGTAATKVDLVPDFDAMQHFKQVRQEAQDQVAEILQGVDIVDDAPVKLFDQIGAEGVSTSAVKKGTGVTGVNDPVAVFEGFRSVNGTYGAQQYKMSFTVNGKKVTALYRDTDTSAPTLKGWLEVVLETDSTDDVDAADLQALHRWITDSIGVDAKLANQTDMELTYWRMVQGNYRTSSTANRAGTPWASAVKEADANLRALGPSPTKEQEIEAIRSAYRQTFGTVVDDADVLPIHSHTVSAEADEFGWGYWERPELSDADVSDALRDKMLYHDFGYNGSTVSEGHAAASTGQALTAQQERLRMGFTSSAASAEADLAGGGASSFFTRLSPIGARSGRNMAVISPHRRLRRLLDYNANHDTYGKVASRVQNFTLDVREAARYSSGNEFMLRDGASYFDDVEIMFFGDKQVRDAWVSNFRARGVTTIRGAPIEERLVWADTPGVNQGVYIRDFFKKYVDTSERLRRPVEALRQGARAAAQSTQRAAARVASRFPTVKGGRIRKTMSVGRSKRMYITPLGEKQVSINVRYHVSENALSVPGEFIDNALLHSDAPIKGAKAKLTKTSGSGIEESPPGEFTVIDLSPFGIDIKEMAPGKRPRFMQAFFKALVSGDDAALAQVIQRYGGVI